MPPGIRCHPGFKSTVAVKDSLREFLDSHPIPDELLMTSSWKNKLVDKIVRAEEKRKTFSPSELSEDDRMLLNRYSFWCKKGKTRYIQYLLERPSGGSQLKDSVFLFSFEESVELIKRAHIRTNHGDAQNIEKFIHNNIENKRYKKSFSRFAIPLFFILEVCLKCRNKYNIGIPELNISSNSFSGSQACHATASVDILEMLPDNVFKHLLIVHYMETNYIQLRPLTSKDEAEIFSVLYQLFMDLIVPNLVIVRPEMFEFYSKIMPKLSGLANTDILVKADAMTIDLKPAVRTRMTMWLKREIGSSWGIACNFVQWEMNNIADIDGTIPYSRMFNAKALENCTPIINMSQFIGNNTGINTNIDLPSTVQTFEQIESRDVLPIKTQDTHVQMGEQNVITKIEMNNEFGATIHIPDDNNHDDLFYVENVGIEDVNCIQNYKDLDNNMTETNIIKMEDDDSEMIIPDIKTESICIESFNMPDTMYSKNNIEISETKYITDNNLVAAKTSDHSDVICIECKQTITTNIYICYKCSGNIHLYCGSQSRNGANIVSLCVTCNNLFNK